MILVGWLAEMISLSELVVMNSPSINRNPMKENKIVATANPKNMEIGSEQAIETARINNELIGFSAA